MQSSDRAMEMPPIWREFWILLALGAVADATKFALSHLPVTPLANFLFVKGNPARSVLFGIGTVEAILELIIVVGLGLWAARSMGLGAPLLERWLRDEPIRPHLRSALVPALLLGTVIGVWGVVPDLPIFHPSRQASHREAEEIIKSPAAPKSREFVERTSGSRIGYASLALSYVCDSVSGALFARLFLISGIAWVLARATGAAPDAVSQSILWLAILLAIAVGGISNLAWHFTFERLFFSAVGMRIPNDPSWLVVTRVFVGAVPAGIGLGWLYIRRGLEAAMIGSFTAMAVGYVASMQLLTHLY
jgi:hypothetical protein